MLPPAAAQACISLHQSAAMVQRHGCVLCCDSTRSSLDRRTANLVFIGVLSSFFVKPLLREPPPTGLVPRWDPEAARAAAKAGALCPAVSCADNRFLEVQAALDTSTLPVNAVGSASEHLPIVYVEPQFGMMKARGTALAQYKVVVVAPIARSASDRVELMWLRDASSGRVVAVRGFDSDTQFTPLGQEIEVWPYTLSASLKEPYVGVSLGERLVPCVYYAEAGLWVGEPFVLCGPEQSVCEGPGVFSTGRISTLNKYGAARTGANLLEAARPALLDTAERTGRARAPSRGFVL